MELIIEYVMIKFNLLHLGRVEEQDYYGILYKTRKC